MKLPVAYLGIDELAALLGVSRDRVEERNRRGELPSVREGRVRLIPAQAARRLWPQLEAACVYLLRS